MKETIRYRLVPGMPGYGLYASLADAVNEAKRLLEQDKNRPAIDVIRVVERVEAHVFLTAVITSVERP